VRRTAADGEGGLQEDEGEEEDGRLDDGVGENLLEILAIVIQLGNVCAPRISAGGSARMVRVQMTPKAAVVMQTMTT
jgi:hypothetical protein